MNRKETKEKELKFLAGESKRYPQLFQRKTFVDDAKFLEKFGFFLKDKENLPLGYVKFWPQDFIVEEISKTGEIQTIDIEPFLNKRGEILETEPTLYATLIKADLSTIEAAEQLTSLLKIRMEEIQFAGIKDKDALTSQLVSFRKTKVGDLQKIISPYFFLKNVYSGKGVVETGSLGGNKFTVLIRTNSSFQERKFSENIKDISHKGFYNFFYLQRFGTPRLINFYWGLFILRGDYEKTVLSFLASPGIRELPYIQKLRGEIKENFGDWEKIENILVPFPIIFQNERKVISYLRQNPQDFIGALNQIPEQVQLWLYAYSSRLFNKKLSFYLRKGVEPPQKMPLILSKNKEDWFFYKEFLEEDKIFPLPLENLKPFPIVQWREREVKTKEKAKIEKVKIISQGVILSFSLSKANYATTFLSHLFNLISGLPPKNISPLPIDTKATLGENSLEDILNRFNDVIHSKNEDVFEKYS